MIDTFTYWEIGLATAIFVLSGAELIGLVLARRQGLTRNVSRLVTHGLLIMLGLIYVGLSSSWLRTIPTGAQSRLEWVEAPTVNWTYLLLAIMIGLLVSYEVVTHLRAIRSGLTTNVSRLANHFTMLILLVVMIGISVVKWDVYMAQLEESYQQAIPESLD